MPQTIAYKTSSEEGEYQAATDTEVDALVADFEAASNALAIFDAENPAPKYVYRNQVDAEAYAAYEAAVEARNVVRHPLERAKAEANKALSASRNLPLGTVVRFVTSAGWDGTDTATGLITKITPTSYVVTKESRYREGVFDGDTARLNRESAHEYRSYYASIKGSRSMAVVRTPNQQRVYADVVHSQQAAERARREAQTAYNEALRAAEQAQYAQAQILRAAQNQAVASLIKRHQAEFDGMLSVALDVLSSTAPGREESTLPEVPESLQSA